jgi:hypothetical protein
MKQTKKKIGNKQTLTKKIKRVHTVKENKRQVDRFSRSDYITIKKYKTIVLGVVTHIYNVKLNTDMKCGNGMTIKKTEDTVTHHVYNKIGLIDKILKKPIKTYRLRKDDPHITNKMATIFDTNQKYTYCLSNDTIVFSETKKSDNKINESEDHINNVKDFMSKHVMLCGNQTCISGEAIFCIQPSKSSTEEIVEILFDNSSGTFRPNFSNLKYLHKAIPYLNIRLLRRGTISHKHNFKLQRV